jgi:nicotinamide-nucleotide amidase
MCDDVIKKLQKVLGNYAYSIDKALEETVLDLLRAQKKTLAVAESCTGGGITKLLTDLPGASDCFGYGFITYSNQAKQELLGVSRETISQFGAVSAECAREMAEGALARSGASIAVAVTGIAGPGADSSEKPVGLIYLHATDGRNSKQLKLETGRNDRAYNRIAATKRALDLVRQLLITEGSL